MAAVAETVEILRCFMKRPVNRFNWPRSFPIGTCCPTAEVPNGPHTLMTRSENPLPRCRRLMKACFSWGVYPYLPPLHGLYPLPIRTLYFINLIFGGFFKDKLPVFFQVHSSRMHWASQMSDYIGRTCTMILPRLTGSRTRCVIIAVTNSFSLVTKRTHGRPTYISSTTFPSLGFSCL